MGQPIAIFGEVDKTIKQAVIELRKEIKRLGYGKGDPYIYTVPHLTLSVNSDFDDDPEKLKSLVKQLNIKSFQLSITDFIVMDENIAAKFDNIYSKKLAQIVSKALIDFKFDPVETFFMKLIRSQVKEEYQDKAKNMLRRIIPDQLPIIKISASGKEIRQEDILWTIDLD